MIDGSLNFDATGFISHTSYFVALEDMPNIGGRQAESQRLSEISRANQVEVPSCTHVPDERSIREIPCSDRVRCLTCLHPALLA